MTVWSTQEDEFILENKTLSIKSLASSLGRSVDSIKCRRKMLGITKQRIARLWTQDEESFLKENYINLTESSISEMMGISINDIKYKKFVMGLHKNAKRVSYDSVNMGVLLNESNISYYWLGFILADGYLSPDNKFAMNLSIHDREHLEKFIKYVQIPKVHVRGHMVTSQCSDTENISKIKSKLMVTGSKTYSPPPFNKYVMNPHQWLSLIIGFIDGDGSIITRTDRSTHTQYCCIMLHKSWLDNLSHISNIIKHYVSDHNSFAKITSSGYAQLRLNHSIINLLYTFSIDKNLPILVRKWDKLNRSNSSG